MLLRKVKMCPNDQGIDHVAVTLDYRAERWTQDGANMPAGMHLFYDLVFTSPDAGLAPTPLRCFVEILGRDAPFYLGNSCPKLMYFLSCLDRRQGNEWDRFVQLLELFRLAPAK